MQIAVGSGCTKPRDGPVDGNRNPGAAKEDAGIVPTFDNSRGWEDHLCAVTTEECHNLYTWGGNDHGQLGRGTKGEFGAHPEPVPFRSDQERIAFVSAGCKFTIAVTEGNHVHT